MDNLDQKINFEKNINYPKQVPAYYIPGFPYPPPPYPTFESSVTESNPFPQCCVYYPVYYAFQPTYSFPHKTIEHNGNMIEAIENKDTSEEGLSISADTSDLDDIINTNSSKTNVYIKGLKASTTNEGFTQLCEKYGKILSAKVIVYPDGQCKGYGFALFDSTESAENGIRVYFNISNFQSSKRRPSRVYSQTKPVG
jgi:hypothetical protein